MASDITVTLDDDAVEAIMWAANRLPDGPLTVGEYIARVMTSAARSYARQAEADQVQTLGKAAVDARKAGATTLDLAEAGAKEIG